MKQKYFKHFVVLFLALLGMTSTANAETVTAEWNWKTGNPATLSSVHIEGNTGTVASTVDGIDLYVDATSGKFKANGDNVAFNAGTILHVPVVSTKDVVTVKAHPYNYANIKIGGIIYTTQDTEYTATSFDVNQGYVEIVSTSSPYLYSIQVVQDKTAATTAFKNVAINMIDQTLITSAVTSKTSFGINVATDGTLSVVEANAENANISFTASNYNGYQHGWTNLEATVKVDGPVKVTLGGCEYGGHDATITDAANNKTNFSVAAACWNSNKPTENISSAYYKGTEATTLTIKCASWTPYIAVEAANPADLKDEATVSFALGDALGVAPASIKDEVGKSITLPVNHTMYIEGKTLTGWSDGTNSYAPGATYTVPEANIELTPVFTANEVSLADRTEAVTLDFTFRKDHGAAVLNYQDNTGFYILPVTINEKLLDVKIDIDATAEVNGTRAKLNNGSWNDWAQVNAGVKLTVPSCKGATVSMEAMNSITTTTIDGQSDYTQGTAIQYEIANTSETIDIVLGDGTYYRGVKIVLPVVQSTGGQKFENVAGTVTWAVGNETSGTISNDIQAAVSSATVSTGSDLAVATATYFDTQMVKYTPKTSNAGNVEGVMIEYRVKPKAGVTFKATSVSYNSVKVGTDGATYSWSYTTDGTESAITEVDASTTRRNDGSNSATTDINHTLNLTTSAANEFTFRFYISKTANNKNICIGNVCISGIVNGSVENVAQYTLAAVASPEDGGSVNVYPTGGTYDAGTTLKLTATENFGYDFESWTDATGNVVSTETVYTFDIAKNETLTANFKQVNTYELKLTVDGTNDYMVTVSPAPTVVDGKNMYEEDTKVALTANQYEGLVTFTNWNDGTTNSELKVTMDGNKDITASYSETDIIAGWDFYKKGNNGRIADFAATDNETAALSLVLSSDGTTTSGWLDKSTESLNGGTYEGFTGAATNWREGTENGDVGHYHWQTKINAEAFTDINVQFQMVFNYNAYHIYDVEYSLDGTTWTKAGSTPEMTRRQIVKFNKTLPEACNNQPNLYIRMIADKNSTLDTEVPSKNDGNSLAMFFITGTPKLVDDPVAPALVSSVPENGAVGASASGKIVLNFDKKVQIVEGTKATLGNQELTPTVSGKVITFEYKGLEYGIEYTFVLPANTVKNQTGATLTSGITLTFTTMERPSVNKAPYDVVVSNVDELVAAFAAAQNRSDKNTRFRIFVKKGTYTLPRGNNKHYRHTNGKSGSEEVVLHEADYPDPITYLNLQNVSIIGEDRDATIITNDIPSDMTFAGAYGTASVYEGIGNSDVIQISGSGNYWQDLTISTGMEDNRGRDIAVEDKGTKTIWKNVCLHGYQDTWVGQNDNGLYYFEGGVIRGRTDYICGKGDAYYNQVEFRQVAGGYCAVPSKPANIGWVMKDCVIEGDGDGVDGNYTLGRPWGSGTPVALWIDTKMNVVPSAIGWNEMSGGWPKRFAEYNSTTSTGSVIDLSGRKKTFADTHTNNPVLTAEEAATYSNMSAMYGEWQPTLYTEQAPVVTNVQFEGTTLSWTGNNYSLLYAICKDGEVVGFTTETSIDVSTLTTNSSSPAPRRAGTEAESWSVRAANEMGGLSQAVNINGPVATSINSTKTAVENRFMDSAIYTLQGVRVTNPTRGIYIINGRKVVIK